MAYYNRTFTTIRRNATSNGTSSCFTVSDSVNEQIVTLGMDRIIESKNPNWRKAVAEGRSATTRFVAETIDLDFSPGSVYSRRLCTVSGQERWATEELSGYFRPMTGNSGLPSAPVTTISTSAEAQAISSFASNARSTQGSFRGSTFVAELADTLRGIRNPAAGIRGLIDTYSKRSKRNVKRATGRDPENTRVGDLNDRQRGAAQRALSESWLEAQFGILPLVSDMGSAYQSYQEFRDRIDAQPVQGTGNEVPVLTIANDSSAVGSNFMSFQYEVHTHTERSVRFYGAVKCRTETFTSSVIEESGFRFRDFVPALWEWIPYSFLVDYFTNIGDILEASSVPRADIAWVSRTFRNSTTRNSSRVRYTKNSSASYPLNGHVEVQAFFPPSVTWRRKYIDRRNYTGSLVPTFRFEIPGFRNFKKYLNIAALVNLRGMRR